MNWTKNNDKRITNGLTLKSYCKNILKQNSDVLSYCSPVTNAKGEVLKVKVIIRAKQGVKGELTYNSVGDILDEIDNLQLINYKIQDLCRDMRKPIES